MRIQLATLFLPVLLAGTGDAALLASTQAAPEGAAQSADLPSTDGSPTGVHTIGGAVAELRRLAVSRHGLDSSITWTEVERALDVLEEMLSTPVEDPTADPWGSEPIARTLQEIAVGAHARERVRMLSRFPAILDAAPDERRVHEVLRAFVRVVEPLVAPADVPAAQRSRFVARATEMFERLEGQLVDPNSGEAPAYVRSARARIERLRGGARMPRFIARDAAGNELRSTQLEGKITVLRFWDPTSPASVAAHDADAEFVRTFWDTPFELVGVNASEDRPSYLEFLGELEFGGTQLFDGPISTQLADELAKDAGRFVTGGNGNAPIGAARAWFTPAPGSVFVVDARGTVRGRDLPHDDLRKLIRTLVDEENSRRREALLIQGRSR